MGTVLTPPGRPAPPPRSEEKLHARRATSHADAERLAAAEVRVATLSERAGRVGGRGFGAQGPVAGGRGRGAAAGRAAGGGAGPGRHRRGQQRDRHAVARSAAADRHTAARARVDALGQALDAAHARAGSDHLSDLDGALGPLLDLVRIDAGWEAAVEAALGEALAAVVVADADSARRALEHLDRADVGGGVLPALGLAPGRGSSPRLHRPPPPAVGRPVRDHVHAAAPGVDRLLDELLDDLLRRSVAVEGGWMAAFEASFAHPGAVVVTRQGDRFSATGFRLGLGGGGHGIGTGGSTPAPGRDGSGAGAVGPRLWPWRMPPWTMRGDRRLRHRCPGQARRAGRRLGGAARIGPARAGRDRAHAGCSTGGPGSLEASRDREAATIAELSGRSSRSRRTKRREADDARRRHQARPTGRPRSGPGRWPA